MNHQIVKFLITITIVLNLISCATIYQVLETKSKDLKFENDKYYFENADLLISYNLWTQGGQLSMSIRNKLDSPITIDLNNSHFIKDGISYEYWYDEEVTNSTYKSSSVSTIARLTNSRNNYGYSASAGVMASKKIKTKQILHIPPKSSININKFTISNTVIFDCEFNTSPQSLRNSNTKAFGIENSPLLFRNYISYTTKGIVDQPKIIDNKMYVSTASFIKQKAFLGTLSKDASCNIKGKYVKRLSRISPYKKANSFFIKVPPI